jgi:integrase
MPYGCLLKFISLHCQCTLYAPCIEMKEYMKEFIGNSLIAKLKPSQKAYDIWDTKIKGFILRILPSGAMVYRCEYGRGKRITLGRTTVLTPAQARDKAKQILSKAAIGELPVNNKKSKKALTLNSFISTEYESWRIANRKNGKDDIRRLKANFAGEFGDCLLSEITPMLIEKWRTNRINKGTKLATVNRDIIILRSTLTKAVEWELISEHPLQKLKQFKTDSIPKIRYLAKDEETELKKALISRDDELRASRSRANEWREARGYDYFPDLEQVKFPDHITPMVLLSLNTGLRRGELFSLQWKNINIERAMLTVQGDTATSGKTRHIPLNAVAAQVLKDWRKHNKGSGLVFANTKTGESFGHVKRGWATLLKLAEIENFRWHDMRHHFASKLVMAGVDLNTVRELLGHADITMTLRYAHLAPEHKANAVARLVEVE